MPPTLKPQQADPKDTTLLDYSSAVKQLIDIAKRELEEVKNQTNVANYQLAQIKDKTVNDANELERWKNQERRKFTDEFSKRQNDIIAKQNQINTEVLQQGKITQDLQTQHQRFESLKKDQLELKEALVKLEGKKIEIADKAKQIEAAQSGLVTQQNQAQINLQAAEQAQEKTRQENIRLVQMNDQLEQRAKKIDEDAKNLADLKEFVEPKLRAIKEEQEALDRAKNENQDLIAKLNQAMVDEKILLQSVNDKKAQLDKDYKDFLSQKEEFTRQQLLASQPTTLLK